MPLQNRVTPFGDVIATPARGTLWGNRGVLHNEERHIVRGWQVRRWIACLLEFKGRHRSDPMPPGRFTGLFFLDEPTALAAGHRPCAECRREDYNRFRDLWSDSHPGAPSMADDMDLVLHAERVGPRGSKRIHPAKLSDLPDGTMIVEDETAWLVAGRELLQWTPFGYDRRRPRTGSRTVGVLTPPSIVSVIRLGYGENALATACATRRKTDS
jgi:hypothetical protein